METPAGSIKEVADLLFAARERIDYYWNFYIVVVIATIGWLVSLKKELSRSMKALVTIGYLIAAGANFVGLYSSYGFAEALRTDLLRMAAAAPLPDTRAMLEQHSYLPQRMAALGIHLVVGVPILLIVWFPPFSAGKAAAAKDTEKEADA
jgi:hypothetical protein